MTIQVAVTGASGRMGTLIADLIRETDGLDVHALLTSASAFDEMIGADVLIDVTNLAVSQEAVRFALAHGLDVVVGTSGWGAERIAALEAELPEGRGVLIVPNFSLGSVLATQLATVAGKFYDSIEILEAHHDQKVDSPSGTAVRTAEAIAAARDTPVATPHPEQPARGAQVAGIPVHALRLRGVVAEQRVLFGGTGELVEIRHETFTNEAYAEGIVLALRAVPTMTGVTVGLNGLLGLDHLVSDSSGIDSPETER